MAIIQTVIKGGGTQPTGTRNITANGVYDVTNYASADVQVPTTAPAYYVDFNVNANGVMTKGSHLMDFSSVQTVEANVLNSLYSRNTNVSGVVDFRSLTSVSAYGCSSMFYMDSNLPNNGITSVDLRNLEIINFSYAFQNAFTNCKGITSIRLDKLKTVSGSSCMDSMFSGCTGLTGALDLSKIQTVGSLSMRKTFEKTSITSVDLSGITTINASSAFNGTFSNCASLQTIDLSNLTSVSVSSSMQEICYMCSSLQNIYFDKLQTISGGCSYAFASCGVVNLDFPALTSITGSNSASYMFSTCKNLETINMKNLTTINGSNCCRWMFQYHKKISTVKFESLSVLQGTFCLANCFIANNDGILSNIYFYALDTNSFGSATSQFNSMLQGTAPSVSVHFPMRIQSTIGSWADVIAGFGGTYTTVLFDIVTTLVGADTNSYARQEKDSTGTATAWVLNDTLYYTSGTTEPTVGATIYSDAACTTAVTTVSSLS